MGDLLLLLVLLVVVIVDDVPDLFTAALYNPVVAIKWRRMPAVPCGCGVCACLTLHETGGPEMGWGGMGRSWTGSDKVGRGGTSLDGVGRGWTGLDGLGQGLTGLD